MKLNEQKAISQIERAFKLSGKILKILIIKKNKNLLDLKK
ncbi:MAG: hypothetical protein LBO62_01420 [Endomicrobium sp.]|jgi:ribosomal protein S6|nr:hypothetical protein [Endomicrobium sp.]